MGQLKFWYEIHNYQSHQRVAEVYRQMLSRRYSPAESIDDADVVILHLEPHDYESIYDRFPGLRMKYVISYCVWEASELPAAYQRSLALVQEVWTCSNYCVAVVKKYHPQVFRIPHTIERQGLNYDIDDEIIRRLICFDRQNYYFLSIGRTLGSRKNLAGLVGLRTPAMAAVTDLAGLLNAIDYRTAGLTLDRLGLGGMTAAEIRAYTELGMT